jgi:hypothetical protein
MAITNSVIYTLSDDDGDEATFEVNVPTTPTLAQYTEFARAYADLLDPIVSGLIRRSELTVPVDIGDLTANVVGALSDVQEINAFQFSTAAGRKVQVNIPGTIEAQTNPNSDDLDTIDAAVAALINAFLSGIAVTGGTIVPSDIDGEDLTALVFAREAARASGKRR